MFSRRHPYLYFMLLYSAIFFSFIVFMTLMFKSDFRKGDFSVTERVGVIEVKGVIADSKRIIKHLKQFREDETVKAIVLRVDSPGGGVGPSQEIYQEIRKTLESKKIITSMGSVAASGGYYIASGTTGIVANPGTITGSIGVIMAYTDFQEVFEKIGLKAVVVKSGKYKDMGSPVRAMTDAEKKILQGFVDKIHRQFVRDAALGRNMDTENMAGFADGRIFTGEEAKALGLIDRIGNLEDAVAWAGELGGIEGEVHTVYPKEKKLNYLEYLMETSITHIFDMIRHTEIDGGYIYSPGESHM